MERTNRIIQNTFFLSGTQIVNIIGRLLFSILLARYLGATNLGYLFIALSFVELFHIITDFGLGITVTREVAADKARSSDFLANTIVLKVLLSLIASIFVLMFIRVMNYSAQVTFIANILIPTIFFNALYTSFTYIFRAYEDMKQESKISLVSSFLYISLGIIAIYLKLNISIIAAVITLASLVNLCLAIIIYLKKYQVIRLSFKFDFIVRLFKMSSPIGIGIILAMALIRVDVIILSLLKGAVAVGLYAAAYKLIATFLFAPFYLATSMFPVMSEWKKHDRIEELKHLAEKTFKTMMTLLIPVACLVSLKSHALILLIYGAEFSASAPVLGILIWYLVVISPAFILTHYLCLSHTKEYAWFNFVALFVNISLNLILIPKLGIIAVAINAVIGALVLAVLSYYKIHSELFRLDLVKIIFLPSISSVGMGFFLFTFKSLNLFYSAFFSFMLYFVILYLVKGITMKDLAFLLNLVRKK